MILYSFYIFIFEADMENMRSELEAVKKDAIEFFTL